MNCPHCNEPLIRRDRTVLLASGLVFVAAVLAGFISWWLLFPTGFLSLIGLYLIAWATIGKGLWCRQCKQVPFTQRD